MKLEVKTERNDFELTNLSWNEINTLTMSLILTKRILEKHIEDNIGSISPITELSQIETMIKLITETYPNWKGQAISLFDNELSQTLTKYRIRNNPITIIN